MSKKIITIHQPDFMPWLGFFAKINKSDTFVVLDHVENKYNEQSWFRRVKLATKSGIYWFSISIKKPNKSHIPINQMEINNAINYDKTLKTIEQSYAKAPFFNEVYPYIRDWFNDSEPMLSRRNMNFIISMMKLLDIKTEIVYSSQLDCKNKSNKLLIEIIKSQNGNIYLCGDGASSYQKDELFFEQNIEIKYNNYIITNYPQVNTNSFIGGLSIIDILMNFGFERTKEYIK